MTPPPSRYQPAGARDGGGRVRPISSLRFVALVAFALALTATGAAAQDEVEVPPLRARVTDLTDTLNQTQRESLESELSQIETDTGAQVAVLIVSSTKPETVEQYAIKVAEAWKLGRKGIDDGVLLLVALNDRSLRIEVGYGLEGALPDAIGKRIVDDIIVPRFRAGDIPGGIADGLNAIGAAVKGEALAQGTPWQSAERKPSGKVSPDSILPLFFFGLPALAAVGGTLRRALGPLPAASILGGGTALAGWLWIGSLFIGAALGILVAVFVLMGGGGRGTFLPLPRGRRGFGGGGFGGGGFSGGGGGFSGGGGSFGGGGASGRW